jgi:hypothetical protein
VGWDVFAGVVSAAVACRPVKGIRETEAIAKEAINCNAFIVLVIN